MLKSLISLDKTRTAGIFILMILLAKIAYANDSLFPLQGARPLAMGGAFIAVSDDYNAIAYNPAGLSQLKQRCLGYNLAYQNYNIDYPLTRLNYYYLNQSLYYCRPYFGIQINSISEGDKKYYYTKIDDNLNVSEVKNINNTYIGYVGGGKFISDSLSLGLTAKVFSIDNKFFLDNVQKGISINIGSIFKINSELSTGVLLENMVASRRQYILHGYDGSFLGLSELPFKTDIGFSYKPNGKLLILIDIRNIFENKVNNFGNEGTYTFKRSYHFGSEYLIAEGLAVRAGIKNEKKNKSSQDIGYKNLLTYSGGFAVRINSSAVDIFISYVNVDQNESFSVTSSLQFGADININF